MRVLVRERVVVPQASAVVEGLDDGGVRLEHLLAREQAHIVGESAVGSDRRVDLQAVLAAGQEVVGAMAGRGVHGPGALLERHVIAQHAERVAVVQAVRETQPARGPRP